MIFAIPISPYGKSKLEAENRLFQHYKEYGVPIAVLRPPVVYGPELYEFSLVSLILKAILKRDFSWLEMVIIVFLYAILII